MAIDEAAPGAGEGPGQHFMKHPLVFSNHGLVHSGGIERYLLTLVKGLHHMGQRPVVVARKLDTGIPEYHWVEPYRIGTWGLSGALRDRLFDVRLRRMKARNGWYPLIALSQTSAADIAICGGTHIGFLQAMDRAATWKDRLSIDLERRHLTNAKVVIAHAGLMADQVQRFYNIERSKVHVLYPPVDHRRFHPVDEATRQQLRSKLGLPPDRCVFLLASTGHARKGLDLAIEALGRSNLPVQLVVAGRPVDVQAPNLRYLGYRSDIEDVYRAVDCTIMASRYEPFGLVGVETVLCGTPLVGATGMGCMEVLEGDAVLPFRIGAERQAYDSLDRAIHEALSRWREGRLRVTAPLQSLSYDPSVEAHLAQLMAHALSLRKACDDAS